MLGNDLRSKDFSSVSKLTKERPALLIFGLVFGSRSGSYFNSLKERKTFYEKVCFSKFNELCIRILMFWLQS